MVKLIYKDKVADDDLPHDDDDNLNPWMINTFFEVDHKQG